MSEFSRLMKIEDALVRGAMREVDDAKGVMARNVATARLAERVAARRRVERAWDAARLFRQAESN